MKTTTNSKAVNLELAYIIESNKAQVNPRERATSQKKSINEALTVAVIFGAVVITALVICLTTSTGI